MMTRNRLRLLTVLGIADLTVQVSQSVSRSRTTLNDDETTNQMIINAKVLFDAAHGN